MAFLSCVLHLAITLSTIHPCLSETPIFLRRSNIAPATNNNAGGPTTPAAAPENEASAAAATKEQQRRRKLNHQMALLHPYENVAKQMNDLFELSSSKQRQRKLEASGSDGDAPPMAMEQGRRNLRALSLDEAMDRSGSSNSVIENNGSGGDDSNPTVLDIDDDLRHKLEESFDNAQDVQDIFEDILMEEHHVELHHSIAPLSTTNDGSDEMSALSEDYYADLPDFVTHNSLNGEGTTSEFEQCKCIDCEQDDTCGGIWKRERFPSNDNHSPMDLSKVKIHIVVSHCMSDLDWIPEFTSDYPVASIHVITKCGKADRARLTAPSFATIEEYENLGRCDHTYAYYITTVLPQRVKSMGDAQNSIAIFLKDDISAANFHQSGHWNTFDGLVKAAASEHGFGCGIIPGGVDFGRDSFDLSTYHETKTLHQFSMDTYNRSKGGQYKIDLGEFLSKYKSLGEWYMDMTRGAMEPPEVMQVCYGGVFSGSVRNIYKSTDINQIITKMDGSVWKNVEKSLSRGNNIQEGHYAERSWAPLIQTHLPNYQLEALVEKADGVYMNKSSFHGALLRRPKMFIHIGGMHDAGGGEEEMLMSSSSEVLADSLVDKMGLLELDGYKVAVYGKYEDGNNGFPNIDQLGPCMWGDIRKSLFPEHMKELTICNDEALHDLSNYMKQTFENAQDMVMLNPLLLRPGSAEPLSIYLNPVWDVKVVLYYRRFFEWISFKYLAWREELMQNTLTATGVPSSYRYIDFLREYCKQLFYGKDVNEDGFPVRKLQRDLAKANKQDAMKQTHMHTFNPTTNFDLEELTGLEDYVYFVAKQYHTQARFRRGIKIVNYHDTHGVETNFYCHVLHDAANSCNDAVHNEIQQTRREHPQAVSAAVAAARPNQTPSILKPSIVLEDIAIEAYFSGRLSFDAATQPRKKFISQISLWTQMIALAMHENNVPIDTLPIECLFKYERVRLFEASLAYEKSLLPDFFASPMGASALENEFEQQRFCSVDANAVLSDSTWDFLFDAASEYAVPKQRKAFIRIGALGTDDTAIDVIAADRGFLQEDNFLFFDDDQGHHIIAPCTWSDTHRGLDSGGDSFEDAISCPDSLLSSFQAMLSKGIASDRDIVVSDEWLSIPSSETGLLGILGEFDPVIVIQYQPFFDWLLKSYYQWHLDVELSTLESMRGKVRLVDFIRLLCNNLFASEIQHSGKRIVDLLDFQDYTYQVWKRYMNIPAYGEYITIVQDRDGIKSFYCDVLNAEKSCEVELDRLDVKNVTDDSQLKFAVPLSLEMAMSISWSDHVAKGSIFELRDDVEAKLTQKGLSEADLPKECLTRAETSMLLMVSLEYERILLPDNFSLGGEEELRQSFETLVESDTFCSVDLERMVDNPSWQFLFEPSADAISSI